jgi:hypothetical protein
VPSSDWPFTLAECDSLALLAAESASYPCLVDAPVELSKDIWFLKNHTFDFPKNWREFMGSHQVDRMKESTFLLAVIGRQNDDVNGLARRVDRLYFCVQIHGFPGLGDFWIALATQTRDLLQPRGIWNGSHCHLPDVEGFATTGEALAAAARMLPGAVLAFDSAGVWQRLQRGKHSLSRAMSERHPDFRLHYYVQALEAVVKPGSKPGETGNDFRDRLATFCLTSPEAATAIKDIYELRCNTEHLHGWVTPRPQRNGSVWGLDERQALLRLWQVENLAFHVYRRILSRRHLLEYFHDDEAICRFWASDEPTRKNVWGEPLDLARYVWKASGHLGVRDYSPLASFPGGVWSGERGDVRPWPRDSEFSSVEGAG